jgi:hypothetical protein
MSSKADGDYEKRNEDPLGLTRNETIFMFATLQRWKAGAKWAQEKREEKIWKDVRVSGEKLRHLVPAIPAVESVGRKETPAAFSKWVEPSLHLRICIVGFTVRFTVNSTSKRLKTAKIGKRCSFMQ